MLTKNGTLGNYLLSGFLNSLQEQLKALKCFHEMPSDAKNRKEIIFGDMYKTIFHDNITADNVLLAYVLFEKIEAEKKKEKDLALSNINSSYSDFYLSYATYWILYFLGEIAKFYSITLGYKNVDEIWRLFPKIKK